MLDSELAKSYAPATYPQLVGCGFGCGAMLCGSLLFRRNAVLLTKLRIGELAVARKYAAAVRDQTLRPQLLHTVPDDPMVLLVGSRQVGKTFSMSHAAKLRKNCLFLGVEAELKADDSGKLTHEQVLRFAYDKVSGLAHPHPLLSIITTWVDVPESFKVWSMRTILRRATTKNCRGVPPTLAFDVHNNSNMDVKSFMEALDVLNETEGVRVIVSVSEEGSHFAALEDYRWTIEEVREVHPKIADEVLSDGPVKDRLLKFLPHTAGVLTSEVDKMVSIARVEALRFLSAFGFACTDKQRKAFAQECLDGFTDPADTTLKSVMCGDTKLLDLDVRAKLTEWFLQQFVGSTNNDAATSPNIMAKYGNYHYYRFQFRCQRHLAERLVACGGDIMELECELLAPPGGVSGVGVF